MLISGQAAVLYGAATFSEDIDLWIEPSIDNWNKFVKLLAKINVRVYKLTPPITIENIQKGHGFHFQLMQKHKKVPYLFLDVMGVVPRAEDFRACFKRVNYLKTDWGRIPVAGIRDLVEIKKTRRLLDYPIISNLVKIEYNILSRRRISHSDWKWILANSFEVEDILFFLEKHTEARHVAKELKRRCINFCLRAINEPKTTKFYLQSAAREIALEIEDLRQKDRIYWEPIIKDLKDMNRKNEFLAVESSIEMPHHIDHAE